MALTFLFWAWLGSSGEPAGIDLSDWPVKLTGEAQLFVDEHLIACKANVTFKVHSPEKHPSNPDIVPDTGWEQLVLAYGSVLRDSKSGRFHMWYTNDVGMAYAASGDGITWHKLGVGLTRDDGLRTNILTRGHRGRSDTLTVFLNPDTSDPEKKYLAYIFEYRFPDRDGVREDLREGVYLRVSPDGFSWRESAFPVMHSTWRNPEDRPAGTPAELGDVNHVSWDPKLGKFVGHVKLTVDGVRKRGFTESDDGIHWSDPRLILEADERDRPGDQTYSMIAFPYESVWLAYVGMFHKGTDDRMDIQLAVSRDGRSWHRPLRETFLPNGPEGSFDWGVLHVMANPPLRLGDKLYIHYGGYGSTHGTRLRDVRKFGIGLAILRPDGFVSLDAGEEPGRIVTRPLAFDGRRLSVNAAVRQGGSIRVAVLDRGYKPLDGYGIEDSKPVEGDALSIPVRWKDRDVLPPAPNPDQVRLRFELKDASLYSFHVE